MDNYERKYRYEVWAKKWDMDEKRIVKYLAGEFSEYKNARIFAIAYKLEYSNKAEIREYELRKSKEY